MKKETPLAHAAHVRQLEVGDFKSLRATRMELGQVNVFIGTNGAGKSNVLEAIGVLGAAAAGIVDDQALQRRGVRPSAPQLFKSSFVGHKIAPKISIKAQSNDGARYHAYLTNPVEGTASQWKFGNETVAMGDDVCASRGPRGNATLLDSAFPLENVRSVAAMVRGRQDAPEGVRRFLAALDDYAIFAPVTPMLRGLAPDPASRTPVGLYGGQLPGALEEIALADKAQNGKRQGPRLVELAREIIDWAQAIETGAPTKSLLSASVPTMRLVVKFKDRYMANLRNELSGYDASEGALYVLFMLVLAMHPASPTCMAIDNFDQALNPRTARRMTQIFVEQALRNGRQVLMTTHNPLVLDGLPLWDPRVRLFVVERAGDGGTDVRRVPINAPERLREQQEKGELPLSRMWVMGQLGGVPDV